MVFEATYLVAVLTPGHASACCGQYGAQISKVLRPNNRSNGMFICLLRAVPRIASEYGAIHPPYAKPPLVSSSGPPGACMTPSREICSSTITFLMTEFLQHLDYYLVASFKVGKRRLKYYVISQCARHLYVGTRRSQPTVWLSAPNKTAAQVGEKAGWLRAMGSSRRSA